MVACRGFLALMPALVAGGDITINVDKLTDFNTDMSFSLQGLPMRRSFRFEVKDMELSGHLQLDLVNEKLKGKFTGSYTLSPLDGDGQVIDEASGESEIVLVNGVVGVKEAGTAHNAFGKQEAAYCIKADVPPGALPPGSALKSMVESKVPQAEGMLNGLHTGDIPGFTKTVSDGVVTLSRSESNSHMNASATAEIGTDGTPISFVASKSYERYNYNTGTSSIATDGMTVKFTDWTKGAGEVDEPQCVEALPSDLDEKPPVMSMALLQTLAEQFSKNEATEEIGMYFSRAAMMLEERVHAKAQVTPTTTWQSLLVPFTAGMSGAAVVLAFAKVFKGKRSGSEPLLSHA